ncbi:chitinase NDAI_0I01890 [Naumovozyma dairenensis CBS 421]|uniref:chitinase n=1 Tax=Naumovozyma dairenensis (strain ATCC 10597 / BCRC 20456 / CBS 421 / NBRC 0211 / NRRL Y-12639) TaxID=1071378 RepID=G0WG47_NAUDC|nr:hypothetical protein NDAI_0I01890 [Naumovozyma dairenensis CBS 421]CCD26758.1 hypothetical protein NDAI_0I01890 [Naumovozyma dairenensis CBS 421]
MLLFFNLLFSLNIFLKLILATETTTDKNIAVYWGQNSAGTQESLATYCQSSDADIFILSFLYEFPNTNLDFSNACSEHSTDGILHCSQIAQDITTCQSLGKKVLLSLGGATGTYGFSSIAEATAYAETLWNLFGEGSTTEIRPFDFAVVDGFDFDVENNNSVGYSALVQKLRSLYETGSKQYYISAAPQCPYPDVSVGPLLESENIDFLFIQFYNNYCNVDKQFNWDTWLNYAETISPNSDIKLFLGLPGSSTAAGSGYISDLTTLESTISKISSTSHFGGIALWDASQAFSNLIEGQTYIHELRKILDGLSASIIPTSTSIYSESFLSTPLTSLADYDIITSTLSPSSSISSTITPVPLSSVPYSSVHPKTVNTVEKNEKSLHLASMFSSMSQSITISDYNSLLQSLKNIPTTVASTPKSFQLHGAETTNTITATSVYSSQTTTILETTAISRSSTQQQVEANTINTEEPDTGILPLTTTLAPTARTVTSDTIKYEDSFISSFTKIEDNIVSTSFPEDIPVTSTNIASIIITSTLELPLATSTFTEFQDHHSHGTPTLTLEEAAVISTTIMDATDNTIAGTVITTTLEPASPSTTKILPPTIFSAAATPSGDSAAHTIAKDLNQQYANGLLNGKSGCTVGEVACSLRGQYSLCDESGVWQYIDCAAGTTCFAYDYDNVVLTQCGFVSQKALFM